MRFSSEKVGAGTFGEPLPQSRDYFVNIIPAFVFASSVRLQRPLDSDGGLQRAQERDQIGLFLGGELCL
jgi:hypothetical protein